MLKRMALQLPVVESPEQISAKKRKNEDTDIIRVFKYIGTDTNSRFLLEFLRITNKITYQAVLIVRVCISVAGTRFHLGYILFYMLYAGAALIGVGSAETLRAGGGRLVLCVVALIQVLERLTSRASSE